MQVGVLERGRFVGSWIVRAVREAGHERYVALQAFRSTLAAVVAWLVVTEVFHFQQAFLAPYVAVFLVEATLVRSLQQAVVQVGAVVTGLLVAVVVTRLVESTTAAIGMAVAVGYFAGRWRRFGASGIWVAITALLVIATGASDSPILLGERLAETMIGAAIGVAVTALVFPPVYSAGKEAGELTGELRDLLRDMASGCREGSSGVRDWVQRARGIDSLVQRAFDESRWAHESARMNPRPAAARAGEWARRWDRTLDDLSSVSSAVEELAHALDPVLGDEIAESDRVRTTIAATLDALAELIDAVGAGREVDPDGACRSNLTELERFATESDDLALTARLGAVLHTARRIVAAMGLEVR
ncbi:Fusaric acid resistance protein-like [Rhodococcus rhodochrous J3]|uniref:FUSC family protein n=2 Tax=Rhodococcus rhodochrous TaxID=1829 RepID=A0AA47ACU6_RHORH|nr:MULTISPECIES: FUSC family protein [Rhodococcus]AYA26080.1 FUSC family protein [Rhodococcus rhodochrous]MBF4476469.1 FUSC family protein [Rhodococcus rhodochrous]MCB8912015.1 FUSC family protein [Rhodococcus rhodochrous]MCD2095560.1 FUSC family protein [Rhodococcus rhodochrous]MCD2120008.1 FUSC family protein [Rhodococcus rhodochrous]